MTHSNRIFRSLSLLVAIALLLNLSAPVRAEHEGKLQILLIGDSTAEGSIPRHHVPEGPHLEQVIQQLLAAEGDLPPTNVINVALSGEYIQRFVDTGRYEKVAAKLPGLDYILIRYGLNDIAHRDNFDEAFPKDFHNLLALLRKDHPQAVLIPMTVIPIGSNVERINNLVKKVAEDEKLPLFDIVPRYSAELAKGPNMLNYRRYPLSKIPAKYHEFVKPWVVNAGSKEPMVEVMDNRLDAQFRRNLPGQWSTTVKSPSQSRRLSRHRRRDSKVPGADDP